MSVRRPLIVATIGFGLCAVSFMVLGLFIYWESAKLINFLAAWIPFVLSVLFAFVPSAKEMKHEWIKWTWRSSVVIVGFAWSVMLWHQQDMTDRASAKQTGDAVGEAVTKANTHSDEKFNEMGSRVDSLGKNLQKTNGDLAKQMNQEEQDLNTNIGKVGKPDPPDKAHLVFTLWDDAATAEKPVTTELVQQDENGSYPVFFSVINDSDAAADTVDLWVEICKECSFAKESEGFENLNGSGTVRHKMLGLINPGASLVKQTLLVNYNHIGPSLGFQIGFHYSCKTCGKIQPSQILTIHVLSNRVIPRPSPALIQLPK